MMIAKVSFAVLCCFIAHTVRCAAVQDGVDASQLTSEKRTMLQEMLIFNSLLNISPFKDHVSENAVELKADVEQTTRAKRIFAELMKLISYVDTKKGIYKTENKEVKTPNYKGENRYLCVKGLLNSMAQKFDNLKNHLITAADNSEELKKKLVEFGFGDSDDILDNLHLRDVKAFCELYYDINSPITNLRKLFRDYEEHQLDSKVQPKAHPFAAFITDSEGGDVLKAIDKSNGSIVFLPHPSNSPLISIVKAEIDNTSDTQLPDSSMQDKDVSGKGTDLENREVGPTSPIEQRVDEQSEKAITEPSGSSSRGDESLPNDRETKEQHISTGEDSGEDRVSVVQDQESENSENALAPPALSPTSEGSSTAATPTSPPTSEGAPSAVAKTTSPPTPQVSSSAAEPTSSISRPSSPTPSTSLRTGSAEKSSQKASSAFDSFVTLLLLVSAVFAL